MGALTRLLRALVIGLCIVGCGSDPNSSPNTVASPPSPTFTKIAFSSARALDGSNAVDTNSCQTSNSCQVVFNLWEMNSDGSNQTPLTMLTVVGGDSGAPAWSPRPKQDCFSVTPGPEWQQQPQRKCRRKHLVDERRRVRFRSFNEVHRSSVA